MQDSNEYSCQQLKKPLVWQNFQKMNKNIYWNENKTWNVVFKVKRLAKPTDDHFTVVIVGLSGTESKKQISAAFIYLTNEFSFNPFKGGR